MSEFPLDFLWGAATAAYSIEGAVREGGRGESIWDRFARTPGAVEGGESGEVACDHYHRWREDVALMQSLGLRAYRFSIAWPRVMPAGRGPANQAGLDFYRRLVDQLLESGILPCATLYHWDLPQELQDAGGWTRRDTAERFADYAEIAMRALGDRVPIWITHDRPWSAAFLGHFRGVHAPGMKDLASALAAAHHMLLSHGRAVTLARSLAPGARIGISLDLASTEPRDQEEADRAALADACSNRWFLDPVFRGAYPAEGVAHFEGLAGPIRAIRDGDLVAISNPIDFLGVSHDESIAPRSFTDLLVRLHADHDTRLLVTGSGAAFDDRIGPDDEVHDPARVEHLRAQVAAALAAIQRGVRLDGYLVRSLLDGFEWAAGYARRFGIVYVDHPTQRRVAKSSARFLARIIREGAAALEM